MRTGDVVRVDLNTRTVNVLISDAELASRRAEQDAEPFAGPLSQTPWQEIARDVTGQFAQGAVIEGAVKYERIAQTMGQPRDSH